MLFRSLRVLLAQVLFADPDIMLLDEPTNNLDINSIRWLEGVLNARRSTMIIISHDRHFLNSVCTRMADLDFGELRIYPGDYDDYMEASTLARHAHHRDEARSARRGRCDHRFPRQLRRIPAEPGTGVAAHGGGIR